jgi:hypothetical protein
LHFQTKARSTGIACLLALAKPYVIQAFEGHDLVSFRMIAHCVNLLQLFAEPRSSECPPALFDAVNAIGTMLAVSVNYFTLLQQKVHVQFSH